MTSVAQKARRGLAALSCLVALAACGSPTTAGGDMASLGTTASEGSGTSDETTPDSIAPEDAIVAFTECMREEGIDMPDPKVISAGGKAGTGEVIHMSDDSGDPGGAANDSAGPGPKGGNEEFAAASEKCEPILDAVMSEIEIDPEVLAEQREQMLAFSQCLRDHGVDFPDPTFNDSGGVSLSVEMEPGADPSDMDAAKEECSHLMGGPDVMGPSTGPDGGSGVIIGGRPAVDSSRSGG